MADGSSKERQTYGDDELDELLDSKLLKYVCVTQERFDHLVYRREAD